MMTTMTLCSANNVLLIDAIIRQLREVMISDNLVTYSLRSLWRLPGIPGQFWLNEVQRCININLQIQYFQQTLLFQIDLSDNLSSFVVVSVCLSISPCLSKSLSSYISVSIFVCFWFLPQLSADEMRVMFGKLSLVIVLFLLFAELSVTHEG